jgi:hypothetical protein
VDTDKAPVPRKPARLRVETTRKVVLRDFVIFQLKLALDGLKDIVLSALSVGALILDFLSGGGKRPRMFYQVLAASERFDLWLNLSGAVTRLESGEDLGDDGLFGASDAGSDSLLGQLEEMVRGGDLSPELRKQMKEELRKRKDDLKRWTDELGPSPSRPPVERPGPAGSGEEGGDGGGDSTGGERDPWHTGR